MEILNNILSTINTYLYSYILIILLIVGGVYFTIRMGFVQIRLIPEAIKQIVDKGDKNKGGVSSFQALMISTASRVGVGNISGVATAIAIGGSGAVFWMWLIAFVGASSAFVESTLAQVFKIRDGDGFRGGPSYYIQKVLKQRWLGIVFSICLIACFGFGFNPLQSNNISSSLEYYFGSYDNNILIPSIIGIVLALLTAFIIFGGVKKITFITSVIVPIMAVIYLCLGFVVVLKNIQVVPELISDIFSNAFDFTAIFGGFSGSCVMHGIKRGLFSNEAGMGSAPNAAAAANVSHPVKQGLVQMISVFIDTLLICTTSAFIILLSNIDMTGLKAMPLVQKAMHTQFGEIGILFITISVFFFAFTSIIGNYYYTESNVIFILNGKKTSLVLYKLFIIAAVFLGSIAGYDLVWDLADVLMGFMATINVIVILMISNIAKKVFDDYMKQKKQGKDPVFNATNVGVNDTEVWD